MKKAHRDFLNATADWLRMYFDMDFTDLNKARCFSIIGAEAHAIEAAWLGKSPQEVARELKDKIDQFPERPTRTEAHDGTQVERTDQTVSG